MISAQPRAGFRRRKSVAGGVMLAFSALTALPAAAQDATATGSVLQITNRTEFLYNGVRGLGQGSSFYEPGGHLLHESDIRHFTTLDGGWRSSFGSVVRYTDSQQFDPNYWSVQYLNWTLTDMRRAFSVGDIYANMSQYSMNTGIKGGGVQVNLSDDQNYFRAMAGTFDGQWAYLLRNDRPDEPMDRIGGGVRFQRAGENWRMGLNMSSVRDRASDKHRGTATAFAQAVPAFDWEYRGPSFVLNGEHAYSTSNISPFGASGYRTNGTANKVALRWAGAMLNFDGNLERVSPNFMTLAGSATTDRWRGYGRVDARVSPAWSVFGVYDYYRDNLNSQLTRTTTSETYELGGRRLRAFERQSLSLTFSLRQRVTASNDTSVNQKVDRWRVGMTDRYFDLFDFRANYEGTLDRSFAGTPTKGKQSLFNVYLASRHDVGGWQVAPSVEYGYQDTLNLQFGNYDISQFMRMSVIANKSAQEQLGADLENNSTVLRTLNGDARLSRARLFWQTSPGWMRGGSVRLEGANNNYVFADSTRNYTEKLLRLAFQWNLDYAWNTGGQGKK